MNSTTKVTTTEPEPKLDVGIAFGNATESVRPRSQSSQSTQSSHASNSSHWSSKSALPKVSAAVVAIALFFCANALAGRALSGLMQDPFEFQNHDACWYAVKNFKEQTVKADVLLLGSSLMCRVVNEGDATYLNQSINALGHYRSKHLEDLLSCKTISLAVGGMNVSDVSVLVPQLLRAGKTPPAIIYGVGPRDFFDNSLESPADAPAFRLAEQMQPLGADVEKVARPGREAQFKLAINQVLYSLLPLYRYQDELSVVFRRAAKVMLDASIAKPDGPSLLAFTPIEQASLHLIPLDVEGYCLVKPDNRLHPDRFDFNNNYFMSYNPFRPALYKRQLFFFDRFLKYSHAQGIQTIVVKMPLRADNYGLMVPNFYNIYSHDVDQIARANGAIVVDAAKQGQFKDDDFTDTVHLSGFGACKLVDYLSPTVRSCLSVPGRRVVGAAAR